jgi:hypothetical protein
MLKLSFRLPAPQRACSIVNGRGIICADPALATLLPAMAAMLGPAAAADCAADLAQARAIAQSISVDIAVPQRPRVGEPIKVTWRKARDERPATPTYLVLTTPAEVRFAGTGFMALTAGAKGPHGLAHGGTGARTFVPFHRAIDAVTPVSRSRVRAATVWTNSIAAPRQ